MFMVNIINNLRSSTLSHVCADLSIYLQWGCPLWTTGKLSAHMWDTGVLYFLTPTSTKLCLQHSALNPLWLLSPRHVPAEALQHAASAAVWTTRTSWHELFSARSLHWVSWSRSPQSSRWATAAVWWSRFLPGWSVSSSFWLISQPCQALLGHPAGRLPPCLLSSSSCLVGGEREQSRSWNTFNWVQLKDTRDLYKSLVLLLSYPTGVGWESQGHSQDLGLRSGFHIIGSCAKQ